MRRAGGARFSPQHSNNGVHPLLRLELPAHTRSPSPFKQYLNRVPSQYYLELLSSTPADKG